MNVFLTRPLFDTPLLQTRLAAAGIKLRYPVGDNICSEDALLAGMQMADALITHTEDVIDSRLLASAPQTLKMIANYGIGFSNIDIDAASSRRIQVTNTPTEQAFDATAEATVALLVAIARQVPALHVERKALNTDPTPSFKRPTAVSIRNKVTGIVGLGRIGSKVATMMHNGFNNRIIYYDLYQNSGMEKSLGATKVGLEALMKNSDFICVNMPLSTETENLIDSNKLALTKPDVVLINTARAGLVNEDALITRLNNGEFHGVGLDVYTDKVNEITAENIALTSHFANFEKEAYTAMTNLVADNVINFLCNGTTVTPVNTL